MAHFHLLSLLILMVNPIIQPINLTPGWTIKTFDPNVKVTASKTGEKILSGPSSWKQEAVLASGVLIDRDKRNWQRQVCVTFWILFSLDSSFPLFQEYASGTLILEIRERYCQELIECDRSVEWQIPVTICIPFSW